MRSSSLAFVVTAFRASVTRAMRSRSNSRTTSRALVVRMLREVRRELGAACHHRVDLRVIGPCACEHLPLDIMVYRDERIPKSRAARVLGERVLEPADRLSAAVRVDDDTTHEIVRTVSSDDAN